MANITKRTVEALRPGERDVVAWDDRLRGFGVRVKPSGVRSYLIQYRNKHGRSRRLTLGEHGKITAEKARELAERHFAAVKEGRDPAEERRAAREAPTVRSFAERYLSRARRVEEKGAKHHRGSSAPEPPCPAGARLTETRGCSARRRGGVSSVFARNAVPGEPRPRLVVEDHESRGAVGRTARRLEPLSAC